MSESLHRYKTEIQQAAQLLMHSQHSVALTGAGISTPSGIPDFRSAASGLWEKYDPTVVASISAFRRKPEDFYDWIRPLIKITQNAQPNPAHVALATLEKLGSLQAVVTQNIDGLHTAAGSEKVSEVHGHVREVECLTCKYVEGSAPHLDRLAADATIPTCPKCNHVLKPKVILFGEQLPFDIMHAAQESVRKADLMIVAGSSLEVAPVSELPWLAHQNQARLIIINYQATPVDHLADIIIRDDVARVLPAIVADFAQTSIL